MNKKGMTLVELIAVIAILGILTLIASPAILGIRNVVLKNTLDSKVSMIKSAALEYGMKHINKIPRRVEENVGADTVPCICDCTNPKGKYSTESGSKTCEELCKTYNEDDDKASDGAYKLTTRSGDYECKVYCDILTVNELISQGYLIGDKENKEILSNPFSDEPLNTSEICIRFTNNDAYKRKIISYIIGEGNLGKWD